MDEDRELEDILRQARSQGITVNDVAPRKLTEGGFGIVATRDHDAGSHLVSVPISCLQTARTVSQSLRTRTAGVSVQGLLAIDLMLDQSKIGCVWKKILPSALVFEQTIPFWWNSSLQKFLPEASMKLLIKQQHKFNADWTHVSTTFSFLSESEYAYHWFLVGTRTFFYSDSSSEVDEDPDECLALLPFVDLFNHASDGCEVVFSTEAYKFVTKGKVLAGEEIFTSYGAHSNDFLLAEYGFVLEKNQHDVVTLDSVLLARFDDRQRATLELHSFWGDYTLNTDGVCYRTQVALRLLCMPFDLWQKYIREGFDEDDEFKDAVDEGLQEILRQYVSTARRVIEEVSRLDARFSVQQAMLNRRWQQILHIIEQALGRDS